MEAESIIRKARKVMRGMLESVFEYNRRFMLSKEQEKLLDRVIFAMSIIDRKFFHEGEAYADYALPIGEGQTISQPSTVARMLLLAELEEGDDVLEIGIGSGWNASLIAFLVYPGNVVSVERFASLKEKAERNFANLRNYLKQKKPQDYNKLGKVNFYAENIFSKGKVWKKKYDKIIITAGIEEGEEKKIEDLAENLLKKDGTLICPHTSGPLIIMRDNGKRFLTKEQYVFVPLLE